MLRDQKAQSLMMTVVHTEGHQELTRRQMLELEQEKWNLEEVLEEERLLNKFLMLNIIF